MTEQSDSYEVLRFETSINASFLIGNFCEQNAELPDRQAQGNALEFVRLITDSPDSGLIRSLRLEICACLMKQRDEYKAFHQKNADKE